MTIIQQVAAAVGENLWDRIVCWRKLGIVLASVERGARNLTEIVRAPKSVEDIWSGIGLDGTDHSAREGDAAVEREN